MLRLTSALLLSLAASASAVAAAQGPAQGPAPTTGRDPAAAEALFRAGITALDQGDWATACPKFTASSQLDPSAGTSINVARCLEHDRKIAQAWAELGRARTLAREASDVRRRELEAFVDREITRIEAKLPRLRIVARDLPPGAEIARDGIVQAPGVVGESIPVDAGEHVVEVRAPGRAAASWKVVAVEGGVVEIAVAAGPVVETVAPVEPPPAKTDTRPNESPLPLVGIVLTGVGVAGLAVGMITGLNAISAKNDIEQSGCDDDAGTCPDAATLELRNGTASRGSDLAAVSTTAFIAGGLLVASGATLLVVSAVTNDAPTKSDARRRSRSAAHMNVTPTAGPGGGGVWVSGAF